MYESSAKYTIATFYKFVSLAHLDMLQALFRTKGNEFGIKGTILLAQEGINATLAGEHHAIEAMLTWMQTLPEIGSLDYQTSFADELPFRRYYVKIKREIVALGRPDVNPAQCAGTYVNPSEWNTLISNPDVTVIDVRNDYEITVGTFKGAQNPHTDVFKEFPDYVQRELDPQKQPKVAMYCTGGIRCEKASALMLSMGFAEVFHLKGGILNYLANVPDEESLWQGDCFVFDDRLVVDTNLNTLPDVQACKEQREVVLLKPKTHD